MMGLDPASVSSKRSRHRFIGSDAGSIVAAVPIHGACTRLGSDRRHDARSRAAPQDEAIAHSLQVLIERTQRAGEPPARRTTKRARAFLVQDVETKQRITRAGSRRQRWVVSETQIVTEPDDDGRG